jgi:hypothetical protein
VVRVLLMLVLVVAAVLYSCGQASSPAERQKERAGVERAEPASEPQPASEPTTASADGTPVGEVFAEAELRPVGDSGVSGTAVFKQVGSLGVQVELSASGLPDPGELYFAQVHEGFCAEAPKGADQEHEEDHGDDHHGHEHERGHEASVPALALVRLDQFLPSGREEYADHAEYEDPPATELPGNVDTPLSFSASADGTAFVTSLLEGVEPEQLSSGSPKYMDMRAASHAAPEEWPLLACADLGEGG